MLSTIAAAAWDIALSLVQTLFVSSVKEASFLLGLMDGLGLVTRTTTAYSLQKALEGMFLPQIQQEHCSGQVDSSELEMTSITS